MKFTEEASNNSNGGAGKYLKIGDNESVYCILRGDIVTSYQKWNGATYEVAKKGEQGASLRFKVNAVVFEDKKPVAKILEGGGHLYFDFKSINEEYPLENTLIKISRVGVRQNTRYTVMPAGPKLQPDAKVMAAVEALELHSLEPKTTANTSDIPSFEDAEDTPF
jgi:hypothetical protein